MWYIIIKEREYRNSKEREEHTMKRFEVTYKEIESLEIVTEIMDTLTLQSYMFDWAYEVINVVEIEVPKKKRFFF